MTFQEMMTLAEELQRNHEARWVKCVRNHLSHLALEGLRGGRRFIPIKYLGHVIGDCNPEATRIAAKPKVMKMITELLEDNGFERIFPKDLIFNSIMDEYLVHYCELPGDFHSGYVQKRETYVVNGKLNFWVPAKIVHSFDGVVRQT